MSAARPRPTPGPFSGLLVIDLTHVLNGPSATTILSDLGARVIKIEPPGHGDDTRTYGPFFREVSLYFSFVNRGKESIVLNLKEDADRTDEVVHMAANPVNHTHRVRDTSLRDWLLLRSPRARWTQ